MNKDIFKLDNISTKQILVLMLLAYFFSFAIRMIWVIWASNNMGFFWNGELMINTNDGYHFATGAEYLLSGKYGDNPKVLLSNNGYLGLQYTTYLLAKYTPFSLDTIILYLPAVVSSLIVIPIILTGTLLRLPWVGFFSALIASITWSYYNRTMAGYYDSDMFAVFLQFTIFYLFLLTIYTKENKNILLLALALLVYPYFYPQGLTITYAMFIFWMMYQLLFQRNEKNSYLFIIIASIALWSIAAWIKLLLIIGIFISLIQIKNKLDYKTYFYLVLVALLTLFLFNHIFELILKMTNLYLDRGLEQSGLHFYQVIQTVREAGKISWETVSNRITGHPILLVLGLVGYIVLVVRHKPFIIALPLIGVGVFAHWAGLRFTVYAVPITMFSLVYLFYFLTQYIKNKKTSYTLFVTLCLFAIYPNISHIINYKVPTVLNATEVQDLAKLNEIADVKDYTLAWWDYGYPIWYYSETSTLIDGGKHQNDNFIISKIMQTSSPELAVNLGRLSIETYAVGTQSYIDFEYSKEHKNEDEIPHKFKMLDKDGEVYHAGGSSVINTLLRNAQKDQKDPNLFLDELKSNSHSLPKKTRDIYLYLPYRMMNIFPTVAIFGNIDLTTGKPERKFTFYPTSAVSTQNGIIAMRNGITFDAKKGILNIGADTKRVKNFIVTQNTKESTVRIQSQLYHPEGNYAVIFMKSYGRFVVMDLETFHSMYVQMFILGKYDKNLFELVVSSPYTKIYRLKK